MQHNRNLTISSPDETMTSFRLSNRSRGLLSCYSELQLNFSIHLNDVQHCYIRNVLELNRPVTVYGRVVQSLRLIDSWHLDFTDWVQRAKIRVCFLYERDLYSADHKATYEDETTFLLTGNEHFRVGIRAICPYKVEEVMWRIVHAFTWRDHNPNFSVKHDPLLGPLCTYARRKLIWVCEGHVCCLQPSALEPCRGFDGSWYGY